MWDWGASGFNVLVTTFVFAVYLTSDAFGDGASTKLALTLAVGGLAGAALAPVVGQWADRSGRAGLGLAVATWLMAAATAAMALVKPEESYLWLGLGLVALGGLFFQIAEVNYNALLVRVSTPATAGRISGLGWGLGYLGGIVTLLIAYFALIAPEVGLFGVSDTGATDVRAAMIVCAAWIVIFTLPVVVFVRDNPGTRATQPTAAEFSARSAYAAIWATVKTVWREDRRLAYFMLSAAVYRDGLAGVFAFGAIIAATSFGFDDGEVILFGVAANVLAGVATFVAGWLDDRVGSFALIVTSLAGMIVAGALVFCFADGGARVFWIFGLALVIFVGPAQNSSRTYLLRAIPPGKEGEVFGLYATTGRALSFLSPTLFAGSIAVGALITGNTQSQSQVWGIVGILLVLGAGLVLLLTLARPSRTPAADDPGTAGAVGEPGSSSPSSSVDSSKETPA